MRLQRASYALSLAIACVASLAPETGCVQVPTDGQQPVLATHVQDWRDEVIYQVIVDRFFDGDVNNDFNVEPGSLAACLRALAERMASRASIRAAVARDAFTPPLHGVQTSPVATV